MNGKVILKNRTVTSTLNIEVNYRDIQIHSLQVMYNNGEYYLRL